MLVSYQASFISAVLRVCVSMSSYTCVTKILFKPDSKSCFICEIYPSLNREKRKQEHEWDGENRGSLGNLPCLLPVGYLYPYHLVSSMQFFMERLV